MSCSATARSRRRFLGALSLTLVFGGGVGCARESVSATSARIAAAASIAPACAAMAGRDAVIEHGASSTLARQIDAGSAADVFVSAHPEWMDFLATRGLLEPGTRRPLAANELVLVRARASRPTGLPDPLVASAALAAAFEGRLAVGDPSHVPAGRYAQAALERLGLWGGIAARIAPAADVRSALVLVVRGECTLGVVYRTDAVAAAANVVIEASIPGDGVRYEAALIRGHGAAGREWFDSLETGAAAHALRERGFVPLGRDGEER